MKAHNLLITDLRENKNYQLPSRRKLAKVIRADTVQPGVKSSIPVQPEGFT